MQLVRKPRRQNQCPSADYAYWVYNVDMKNKAPALLDTANGWRILVESYVQQRS